jgi:hypothetical protein
MPGEVTSISDSVDDLSRTLILLEASLDNEELDEEKKTM